MLCYRCVTVTQLLCDGLFESCRFIAEVLMLINDPVRFFDLALDQLTRLGHRGSAISTPPGMVLLQCLLIISDNNYYRVRSANYAIARRWIAIVNDGTSAVKFINEALPKN